MCQWCGTFLQRAGTKIIIFVDTKRGCDQLARMLSGYRINALAIHGDKVRFCPRTIRAIVCWVLVGHEILFLPQRL